MKKMLGIALGLALMAPFAFGQTTNVLSQNAVGYVKVTVPRGIPPALGGLELVRMDFEQLNPAVPATIANLIGDQLPQNSKAHIWRPALNAGAGGYASETKTRSGWSTSAGEVFRGDAFWLEVPTAAAAAAYDVYLMGEVPGANNNSTSNTIVGINGVEAVGYPYPAAILWSNTTVAPLLPQNSKVHFWVASRNPQGYDSFTKTRSGWGVADAFVIQPGRAFWIETAATVNWTEVKPYVWP